MSGFGDRVDRVSKKFKLNDDNDNDAARQLVSLRGDPKKSGFDRLLEAIEVSENITYPHGGLSRNSSVTSFFSTTSSPALSRQSSISSFYPALSSQIPDDVQKGISQLTEKDIDAIRLKLEETSKETVCKNVDIEAQRTAVLNELDSLIDKLLQNGINSCIFISDILKRLFQILKCGIYVANTVFDSKLCFRLFLIISTIGYFSNPTCAAVINTTGAAIFKIMDFILQRFPENYAKLQAIFTSINNVVQFIGAAFGLISEKGMAMIEWVRIMMDLMEGATAESIQATIDAMKALMETLQVTTADIAAILAEVKKMGLSGEQMAHVLLSIMKILAEIQAGQVVPEATFIKRIGNGIADLAADSAPRLAAGVLFKLLNSSAQPTLMLKGGKRKKATRKNKKKTANKRIKQQKKSKRR